MNITLVNKNHSFVFNISSLMPISYLRSLANKSFHIPEYLIVLKYENNKIEKEFNETSLIDYFSSSNKIKIEVSEAEPKTIFKNLLKSSKISRIHSDEKLKKKT